MTPARSIVLAAVAALSVQAAGQTYSAILPISTPINWSSAAWTPSVPPDSPTADAVLTTTAASADLRLTAAITLRGIQFAGATSIDLNTNSSALVIALPSPNGFITTTAGSGSVNAVNITGTTTLSAAANATLRVSELRGTGQVIVDTTGTVSASPTVAFTGHLSLVRGTLSTSFAAPQASMSLAAGTTLNAIASISAPVTILGPARISANIPDSTAFVGLSGLAGSAPLRLSGRPDIQPGSTFSGPITIDPGSVVRISTPISTPSITVNQSTLQTSPAVFNSSTVINARNAWVIGSQNFGTLNVMGVVRVDSLSPAAFNRQERGLIDVANSQVTLPNLSGQLVGGGGAPGSTTRSILPFAGAVAVGTTGKLEPLTNFEIVGLLPSTMASTNPASNASLVAVVPFKTPLVFNSLALNVVSGQNARQFRTRAPVIVTSGLLHATQGLAFIGGAGFDLGSEGILRFDTTIPVYFNAPLRVQHLVADGYIVQSVPSNAQSLTLSRGGIQTGYTVDRDSQLVAPGGQVILSGGVLAVGDRRAHAPDPVTLNSPIRLTEAGGNIQPNVSSLTLGGAITGTGPLALVGRSPRNYEQVVTLAGNVSTTGTLSLANITLIADPANLESAASIDIANARLVLGPGTLTRAVNNSSLTTAGQGRTAVTARIEVSAGTLTYQGPGTTGTSLEKGGPGRLDVRSQMGFASVDEGVVSFSGPGVGGVARIERTGRVIVDNSQSHLPNRFTGGVPTYFAGALEFIPNPAGSSLLTGRLLSGNFAEITLRSTPAGLHRVNSEWVGTTAIDSALLVRGDNLGSPAAGGTQIFGAANSAGALLARIVVDRDANGPGRDWASYSATTGITPLASYTNNALTGNANITTPLTTSASGAPLSLRIDAGGSLVISGTVGTTNGILVLPGPAPATVSGTGALFTGTAFPLIVTHRPLLISTRFTSTNFIKLGDASVTFAGPDTTLGVVSVVGGTVALGPSATATSFTLSRNSTYAAPVVDLTAATPFPLLASGTGTGTVDLGAGTWQVRDAIGLALRGSGVINFDPHNNTVLPVPDTNQYTGQININTRAVLTANDTTAGNGKRLNLNANGTLYLGPTLTEYRRDILVTGTAVRIGGATPGEVDRLEARPTLNLASNIRIDATALQFANESFHPVLLTGVISGPGRLEFKGLGNFELRGINTHTGNTVIDGRFSNSEDRVYIGVGNDNVFSTGFVSATHAIFRADAPRNIANRFSLGPNTQLTGIGSFTFQRPQFINNASVRFDTVGDVVLNNLNASKGSTLAGSSKVIFQGHTFSYGPITANGLDMVFRGPATILGDLTLLDAMLSGSSRFSAGPWSLILSTSTIDPGEDSPARLSLNSLRMTQSLAVFDIAGPVAGVDYDQVSIAPLSTLTIQSSTLQINLDPNYSPALGTRFILFDGQGSNPIVGNFSNYTHGQRFFLNSTQFEYEYASGLNGNNISIVVVPEPASAMLLPAAALPLLARRRRSNPTLRRS